MNLSSIVSGMIPKARLLGLMQIGLEQRLKRKLSKYRIVYDDVTKRISLVADSETLLIPDGDKIGALVPEYVAQHLPKDLKQLIYIVIEVERGAYKTSVYYVNDKDEKTKVEL